jgi:hypothetical protein
VDADREDFYIGARTQVPGRRNILPAFASIDINVLPQIILYNSCVRAGGRVKARACHSSLMDVYWKSFSQATREILPAFIYTLFGASLAAGPGIGKFIFTGAGEHPLEKLLGVKRDLIYL